MRRPLLVFMLLAGSARAEPSRVVSLNLCTDQILVLLAPEKVRAVSTLARDPALSFVAKAAERLPVVRADAEAVLRLEPDLVLVGRFGAQAAAALLEQHGLHVVRLDAPQDFAAIRAQLRELAATLGVPARAEPLIQAMDANLRVPRPALPVRAMLWEPRGWTAGPGSLGDSVLRAAGFDDIGTGRQIGLETLIAHPPDLLVTAATPEFPSLATDLARHPALAGLPRRSIPPELLICGGPFSAEAVQMLAR